MVGVALGFARHEPVLEINLHDFTDLRWISQDTKTGDECERLVAFGNRRVFQFSKDRQTNDKLIVPFGQRPPFACPVAARLQVALAASFVIETRHAGFDVDKLAHDSEFARRLGSLETLAVGWPRAQLSICFSSCRTSSSGYDLSGEIPNENVQNNFHYRLVQRNFVFVGLC